MLSWMPVNFPVSGIFLLCTNAPNEHNVQRQHAQCGVIEWLLLDSSARSASALCLRARGSRLACSCI